MTNTIENSRGSLPIDQMDNGLDLLVTAETALHAAEWLDKETLTTVRGTIEQAIKLMRPARERLDQL